MRALSFVLTAASCAALGLLLSSVGCGDDGFLGSCNGAVCGACPSPLSLHVTLDGGGAGPITITGVDAFCYAGDPGKFECSGGNVGPGEHTATISAAGYASQTLTFTIAPAGSGCCACTGTYDHAVVLTPLADPDAGPGDAATDVATEAATDAGACDPSVFTFPAGGKLQVGQLCDDVYVCVPDQAAADAVRAASSKFTCTAPPAAGCTGWGCRYADPGGPSLLDANELAEICKVTLVRPAPAMTCMIYL